MALIIDEAQNLSSFVLEQISMLSNLETEKEKMLQIVLIGQRELEKKLQSSSLRQLNQRIAIRHRLLPLNFNETESYIQQRLTVAGAQGNITFSRSALREIFRFSHGLPRLINLLCERILLAAFVDQAFHFHKGLVKRAEKSLAGMETNSRFPRLRELLSRPVRRALTFGILLFSLGAGSLWASPEAKKFLWTKVQKAYWQISGTAENPTLKIGEKGRERISAEFPGGGPKT